MSESGLLGLTWSRVTTVTSVHLGKHVVASSTCNWLDSPGWDPHVHAFPILSALKDNEKTRGFTSTTTQEWLLIETGI